MPTVQGTEDVTLGPSGYNLNVASTVGFFQPRISNPWLSIRGFCFPIHGFTNPWLYQPMALPTRGFYARFADFPIPCTDFSILFAEFPISAAANLPPRRRPCAAAHFQQWRQERLLLFDGFPLQYLRQQVARLCGDFALTDIQDGQIRSHLAHETGI